MKIKDKTSITLNGEIYIQGTYGVPEYYQVRGFTDPDVWYWKENSEPGENEFVRVQWNEFQCIIMYHREYPECVVVEEVRYLLGTHGVPLSMEANKDLHPDDFYWEEGSEKSQNNHFGVALLDRIKWSVCPKD